MLSFFVLELTIQPNHNKINDNKKQQDNDTNFLLCNITTVTYLCPFYQENTKEKGEENFEGGKYSEKKTNDHLCF